MIFSLITLLRLLVLVISVPVSWLICLIFYPILPLKYWAFIVRNWAYFTVWLNGTNLEIIGKHPSYMPRNSMVIANHMTWLDTVILYCICYINFVGKSELRKWPILSTMIRAGGTIFINRTNKRDILKINPQISNELMKGKCVGLFPEGSVNNGHHLLSFKSALFEAAILAKATIIPVVLVFYKGNNQVAYEATYANCNLIQNIFRILRLKKLIVKAIILEEISASNFTSREALASHLYNLLSHEYNKQISAKNNTNSY